MDESYYMEMGGQQFAHDLQQRVQTLMVSQFDMPKDDPKPEPIIRNKRFAGRKKLTPEQVIARHKVLATERSERSAQRKERIQARELEIIADKERKAKAIEERKANAAALEETQRRFNKRIITPELITEPLAIHQDKIQEMIRTAGVPSLPGQTAVRINSKTVIYIKNSVDIAQGIHNYKLKHNLI
ncbi:hypothetical protein [Mucilaginibacter sp.]